MASGKSATARALADNLNFKFVDIDEQIALLAKKSINKIFEEDGEEHFRLLESQVLTSLINLDSIVVAAGGGTPCFHHNMEFIQQSFISVFLNAKREVLIHRLSMNQQQRPLLKDVSSIDSFIDALHSSRLPYYRLANFQLDIENESTEEIVSAIISLIS
jgi:shikimate kinase